MGSVAALLVAGVAALLVTGVAAADTPPTSPTTAPATTPTPTKTEQPYEPKPDGSATDAANANLESTARRQGKSITFGVGGGFMLGFGIDGVTGSGGAGSLRLSQAATARTVVTLEIAAVGVRHAVNTTTGITEEKINSDTNLLAGAQFYINKNLWVRAAIGLGVFAGNSIDAMGMMKRDVTLPGLAGLLGGGVDIFQFRRLSMGFEVMGIGMLNREGMLSSSALLLTASLE